MGVHKTATTHIQESLWAQADWLRARGRVALSFNETQEVFQTPLTWALDPPVNWRLLRREVASALEGAAGGAECVIVSFERFLGPLRDLFSRDALYPEAAARVHALAGLLSDHQVTVFLALRDYARFAASAYCEALRWGPFFPFDAVRDDLLRDGLLDWRPLVTALLEAFGADAVRLWRYEDYGTGREAILRALTRLDEDMPTLSDGHPRARFSREAVAAMAREAGALPPATHPRRIADLARAYPTPQNPPFDPWTADEAARLSARYAHHLAELPPGLFLPLRNRA
ncbi:MAG: hypothetical protein AAFQ51_07480 [Pseudomonadota bacterium]